MIPVGNRQKQPRNIFTIIQLSALCRVETTKRNAPPSGPIRRVVFVTQCHALNAERTLMTEMCK